MRAFADKYALLDYSISQVSVSGLWLEFGVYKGATLKHIASRTLGVVYGFDSFSGLPEDWTKYRKGAFKACIPARLADNVKIIKGLFEVSIPEFVKQNPDPVAFMHVDCDLYASTRTVFEFFGQNLQVGSIIVFDEFRNYPDYEKHEFKAFMEYIQATSRLFDYVGEVPSGSQVAVRLGEIDDTHLR